jgi:hypothetical protein
LGQISDPELAEIAPRDWVGKNQARPENDQSDSAQHEQRVPIIPGASVTILFYCHGNLLVIARGSQLKTFVWLISVVET